MPEKPTIYQSPAELRRHAEQLTAMAATDRAPCGELDAQRLLHELEVHQIELEMQNAELRLARDEAEKVLEKYTDLYDFAPVSYFTLSSSGIIQLANLTGSRLVATERSRLIGRSFVQFVSPELYTAFKGFLDQVFASHTKHSIDSRLQQQPGQPLRSVRIEAHRSPDGEECRVAVIDITERVSAEVALRYSEEFNRSITESSPDCIKVLNLAGNLLSFVHGASELLGIEDDKPYLGRPWLDFWHGEDRNAACRALDGALVGRAGNFVGFYQTHREEPKWWDVRVSPILDSEGRTLRILIILRDVTTRTESELILRRNEVLFAALIEQAPVGVYVLDATFSLQQVNPSAHQFFQGIEPLIGRDFAEIFHLLYPAKVAAAAIARFRETLLTGEPYQSAEFAHIRRGSHQKEIYEWQIQRVTLPAGEHGVVCFFTDITARKEAEAAQRDLAVLTASNLKLQLEIVRREALEQALHQTREEESRLLAQSRSQELQLRDLSHQIIYSQENERKRISRELHDVIAQTLVGINMSVAALGHRDPADLVGFQQQIADTREMVEKSVDVVHQFARELRPTMLDDLGLIPALRTLMQRFMAETGVHVGLKTFAEIENADDTIRTTLYRVVQESLANIARHAQASHAEVMIKNLDGTILMEITDDGRGFEVAGVFDTKSYKRLGLIGMRERVEMIDGTFQVESNPGQGTIIRVRILPQKRSDTFSEMI